MRKISKILVLALVLMAVLMSISAIAISAEEVSDETNELPEFPEAVVTPIENENLTFALNFGIKGASIVDGELVLDPEVLPEDYLNAVLEVYGSMYVDYRLTIENLTDTEVVFNADGNQDGYLGGQYDAWSSNWVYVPFDDVTIANGGNLMIMETAASMLGQAGLRYTLAEIATVVIDFDCGVYFTDEFLAANENMKVTLELIVFNEDENGEMVDVIPVATNEFYAHDVLGHEFVEGECTKCDELDPNYVNTLVVGDTNKVIVNGDTFNDYNLPIEWIPFIADEKAEYTFAGDTGALVFVFDMEGNLLCGGTGKATLEAGTYLICVGNGLTGAINVAVTKTIIEVPHEHVFVEGKCECGEVDPDYQPPVDPQPPVEDEPAEEEEENVFARIWAIILKILAWVADFFKDLFGI